MAKAGMVDEFEKKVSITVLGYLIDQKHGAVYTLNAG